MGASREGMISVLQKRQTWIRLKVNIHCLEVIWMPVISKWQIKMIRLAHLEASLKSCNRVPLTQWLCIFLTVIGFQKFDTRLLVSPCWMCRPSHGLPWCVYTEETWGDSWRPVLEVLYSLRGCRVSNDARIWVSACVLKTNKYWVHNRQTESPLPPLQSRHGLRCEQTD